MGGFRGSQIQMSGEAVKLLDGLAPNVGHVCGFVWENTIHPSIPQGAFWGFRGSQSLGKMPKGWTDWHQIRYTSVDSSGNRYHTEAFCGVLGGQQFKSLGNVVKRLNRL